MLVSLTTQGCHNPLFVKKIQYLQSAISWNAIKWSMLVMHSVPKREHSLVASIIFMYLKFLLFYIIIFSYKVFNVNIPWRLCFVFNKKSNI